MEYLLRYFIIHLKLELAQDPIIRNLNEEEDS